MSGFPADRQRVTMPCRRRELIAHQMMASTMIAAMIQSQPAPLLAPPALPAGAPLGGGLEGAGADPGCVACARASAGSTHSERAAEYSDAKRAFVRFMRAPPCDHFRHRRWRAQPGLPGAAETRSSRLRARGPGPW